MGAINVYAFAFTDNSWSGHDLDLRPFDLILPNYEQHIHINSNYHHLIFYGLW